MSEEQFSNIEQALDDLRQGKMVLLVDDDDRENEGDLVFAAEHVTSDKIAFMIRHTSGIVVVPMSNEERKRLGLDMMVGRNTSQFETAFTVSIEARTGVTTGVSAADRARTIQVASDPNSTAADLARPGHVFPLCAREGGVLVRTGHTEGSVDLMKLAGLRPMAVIAEVMNPDGSMSRLKELRAFARAHDIKILSINQIIQYRVEQECLVKVLAKSQLPIRGLGEFSLYVYANVIDNEEHVVLVKGDVSKMDAPLVRVHSECLTGDIFHSAQCDCGTQLDAALNKIGKEGGILVYMRQEGRGIGLVNKIKAYALQQEEGLDTVEANERLGFAADHREYGIGSQIIRHLGVTSMRLMTNNPRKIHGLSGFGLNITEQVPVYSEPTSCNRKYLATKKNKMGHLLSVIEEDAYEEDSA